MLIPRVALARRTMASLDAIPSRIPVLVGPCGAGRTTLLAQLRDRMPRGTVHYVDVEHTATTPERFLDRLASSSPFPIGPVPGADGPRAAFDATLQHLRDARAPGGAPATFLLDEFLELQTFENFPNLRRVLHEFVETLDASPNHFVLGSRYTARTLRLLRHASSRFEVEELPPFTPADALELAADDGSANGATRFGVDGPDREYTARAITALTDGRPAYVRALTEALAEMSADSAAGDVVAALAGLLSPGGRLAAFCNYCYELRLHRARGYGALKAILEILSEEEGLKLTDIAIRLHRTPGSTKDYLSWLEDVDLVASKQKRYRIADPLLAVWIRLFCRTTAPSDQDVAREVHRYALPRLPPHEPGLELTATAAVGQPDARKEWGIIEID